jgi:hypothetical protein
MSDDPDRDIEDDEGEDPDSGPASTPDEVEGKDQAEG